MLIPPKPAIRHHMAGPSSVLPQPIETIAELRQLYRAAEARAARMRFLSQTGRDLAAANADTINAVLQRCADRLAHFLGSGTAEIHHAAAPSGFPIARPGSPDPPFAVIVVAGVAGLADINDPEDSDAVRLQLELMALTADRIEREQDRARLVAALQEREQRLEFVIDRLFSAQEEERRRVSHELHDGVAQTATALVRMIEGTAGREAAPLAEIARGLVQELRGVIANLRPPLLDDLGLEAAIRALVEQLVADGFAVEFTASLGDARWPPIIETAVFRIAQESFTNIRKHAGGPCRVEVILSAGRDGLPHRLVVRDQGRGCHAMAIKSPGEPGVAVGVEIMRERMVALGGAFEWDAAPGRGVTVTAIIPSEAG